MQSAAAAGAVDQDLHLFFEDDYQQGL
jgi:hypothetical protein